MELAPQVAPAVQAAAAVPVVPVPAAVGEAEVAAAGVVVEAVEEANDRGRLSS